MTNIILRDRPQTVANLLPLTYTHPVSRLLTGIFNNDSRWDALCLDNSDLTTLLDCDNRFVLPAGSRYDRDTHGHDNIWVDSAVIATPGLFDAVINLPVGAALTDTDGDWIANRGAEPTDSNLPDQTLTYPDKILRISQLYDIFELCGQVLEIDYMIYRFRGTSSTASLHESNRLIGPTDRLIIRTDKIHGATLNTTEGPIVIAPGAEIMEGANLRGPLYIGPGTQIKMGARIYGPSAIGAQCRVGGEVANVVMMSCSNKAHDGFLGNAVIGQWCNIGAGCNASNLKNDYTEIKMWNYPAGRFLRTGLIHCGPVLGDHTKLGVNTMLNTATVLGVGVNIHGTGFPRNYVPCFAEGGAAGFQTQPLKSFIGTAKRVMARRGIEMSPRYEAMLTEVYNLTTGHC